MQAFPPPTPPPGPTRRTPPGHAIYAVGDIHGRLDLLDRMLGMIRGDAAFRAAERKTIVYLGDYVDRGPDSRGVVDRLIAGPPAGFEQVCLMGNHEAWLLDFLEDPSSGAGWLMNGGAATLASYGVPAGHGAATTLARIELLRQTFVEAVPQGHRDFLGTLARSWRAGDYAFVHAGVRPGVALEEQRLQDLLWIRDEFLFSEADFGPMIVHGHTIEDRPDERANRIGIDTGAFATGRLTCLCLEGAERRYLET